MMRYIHVLSALILLIESSGISVRSKVASTTPSVRIVLTEQCGTYDLMVNFFVKHTQDVLGNIPFTILESCDDPKKSVKNLPPNVQVVEASTEAVLARAGKIKHGQEPAWSKYPWISRPYSVVKYLTDNDVKEDIIVLAEYDWVWMNPELFWEWVGKVQPGQPVGVWYQYLEAGINDPNSISPLYGPDNKTSASRALLNRKSELQPVGVPIFILKDDLVKMMGQWAELTDDMLLTQEKAGWDHHQRITEMYSWMAGALSAGLKHQVIHYEKQFSPGYWAAQGDRPLFGHYCYPFELCGKRFSKGQFSGPVEKVCHNTDTMKPPDPMDNWFENCTYREVGWGSGGGDVRAKRYAYEMLKHMYDTSKALCKEIELGPKAKPPAPVAHAELIDEHASHGALASTLRKKVDPSSSSTGDSGVEMVSEVKADLGPQMEEARLMYENQELKMVLASLLAFCLCGLAIMYWSGRAKKAEALAEELKRTRLLGEVTEFGSMK